MEQFSRWHPQVRVKSIVADALYGYNKFMDAASALFRGVQVISQLKCKQNIRIRNRKQNVTKYFASYRSSGTLARVLQSPNSSSLLE
jgi:hypothetical protein